MGHFSKERVSVVSCRPLGTNNPSFLHKMNILQKRFYLFFYKTLPLNPMFLSDSWMRPIGWWQLTTAGTFQTASCEMMDTHLKTAHYSDSQGLFSSSHALSEIFSTQHSDSKQSYINQPMFVVIRNENQLTIPGIWFSSLQYEQLLIFPF